MTTTLDVTHTVIMEGLLSHFFWDHKKAAPVKKNTKLREIDTIIAMNTLQFFFPIQLFIQMQ